MSSTSQEGEDSIRQGETCDENWNGPDDPGNPKNFSTARKVLVTLNLAFMVFISAFSSSVLSPATEQLSEEYGISTEVCILATALYVLGFAFGPMLFGPTSEVLGRKYPLAIGIFISAMFTIPVAVAQNPQTVFVCRFLAGTFGVAPLSIAGGALADMYDPLSRGIAVAGFASASFLGPVAGPIVGGFVTMSHLGWRWTQWITLIAILTFLLMFLIIVPETYGPVILSRRAEKLRHETRNWALHAKADERRITAKNIGQVYVLKPWIMVVQEPILALITLYIGFIYGFLYLCFEAYPIAFEQQRGWNLGVGALPFLGITVGVLVGIAIIILHTKTRMRRKTEAHGEVPEERLIPMILASFLMPIGMFWFAWTSNPHITWVPQVISSCFLGCGILLIFLQGLNYLIDVYKMNANSAIAINAMFRGVLGAGFPMFSTYMFHNLGVPWAMSLLGFFSIAMIPVPILFYIYGAKIRKWSRFSPY
ncbi:putative MFS transporter [Hypoxylon trugodes]|uniref:putative MFS transporter n=1 Tax=Hypoxylon trugodes TaxID=326681 RepID=UPI00218FB278|nr:putative MFS transporter [Hypoxylon trugodes]KAI1390872.1 putative MFS transporter [Hypoxylon trugodes]